MPFPADATATAASPTEYRYVEVEGPSISSTASLSSPGAADRRRSCICHPAFLVFLAAVALAAVALVVGYVLLGRPPWPKSESETPVTKLHSSSDTDPQLAPQDASFQEAAVRSDLGIVAASGEPESGEPEKLPNREFFDAGSWTEGFCEKKRNPYSNGKKLRAMRCVVQQGTISALEDGCYLVSPTETVHLDMERMRGAIGKTLSFRGVEVPPTPPANAHKGEEVQPPFKDMLVEVWEQDCLLAARSLLLKDPGSHVAVLNMANSKQPGGGWKHGCGAQEENLMRRTNLAQYLVQAPPGAAGYSSGLTYPLAEDGGAFSYDVCAFRDAEAAGYRFLEEPYFVSVISVAACNRPKLTSDGRMVPEVEKAMREKIRALLSAAWKANVHHLVLSAFGSGSFKCPPVHVAQLFRESLSTDFAGRFKTVAFAIIEDHNSGGNNVQSYRSVMNDHLAGSGR